MLYLDGIAVAENAQNRLQSPTNGFYIGIGNAMTPGTFFSRLTYDVRIDNRALSL